MFRRVFQLHPFSLQFFLAICLLLASLACGKSLGPAREFMWVSAPQANLRDKLATLYNKAGIVHNGDRVEVLEKQKRFVRVRTAEGAEGWLELRYLVGVDTFNAFQKLSSMAASLPSQGHAATRASLNMHIAPSREADVLYQLRDGDKVDILKRAVSEKILPGGQKPAGTNRAPLNTASGAPNAPKLMPASSKAAGPESPAPVMEDWWLVRDSNSHAGWVLGRMLDLDVPLEIAQYAEGQRIVGCFVLNEVQDEDKKVPQYLTLVTEPHDGSPYDFDQVRVFTWNTKRHRYETGYRERKLFGKLPVKLGRQDFGKDGVLPVFTIRVQDGAGQTSERTYRLMGPIVRRVQAEDTSSAAGKSSEMAAASEKPAKPSPVRARTSRRHRRH